MRDPRTATSLRPLALSLELARQILNGRAFMVETRLRPLPGLAEVWGTSDLVGFSKAGPVDRIIDLKFGEGILVEADEVQLGIYALLAARMYGASPDGVTAWIIQPRCDHADGPARQHHYTCADLDQLESAYARQPLRPPLPAALPPCRPVVPVLCRSRRMPNAAADTGRSTGRSVGVLPSVASLVRRERAERTLQCTAARLSARRDRFPAGGSGPAAHRHHGRRQDHHRPARHRRAQATRRARQACSRGRSADGRRDGVARRSEAVANYSRPGGGAGNRDREAAPQGTRSSCRHLRDQLRQPRLAHPSDRVARPALQRADRR